MIPSFVCTDKKLLLFVWNLCSCIHVVTKTSVSIVISTDEVYENNEYIFYIKFWYVVSVVKYLRTLFTFSNLEVFWVGRMTKSIFIYCALITGTSRFVSRSNKVLEHPAERYIEVESSNERSKRPAVCRSQSNDGAYSRQGNRASKLLLQSIIGLGSFLYNYPATFVFSVLSPSCYTLLLASISFYLFPFTFFSKYIFFYCVPTGILN